MAWRLHCRIWRPWPGLTGPYWEKDFLLYAALPHLGKVQPTHGILQQETEGCLVWSGGSVPPCAASKVLTYSSRGQMGMTTHSAGIRPALQGTRGGMGRPVVGREGLQGTDTSLGGGVSVATKRLLVETAADSPELDTQGETAPRGRSYESNAVMVETRDISVKLLQNVGRFQALPGTCCSDEVSENPFLGTGADQRGGVQTIWTLFLCGTAVDQPWLLLKFWTDPPSDRSSRDLGSILWAAIRTSAESEFRV